jgi:hypothetical protein
MPILNMIYWATWWGGGWRQPWANTIAYYPLDSTNTVKDLSWNGYNFTGSATFWVDEWVDCYQCRSNGNMLKNDISLLYNKSNFTVNLWFFQKSQVSRTQLMFKTWALSAKWQMFLYYISWGHILYASKYFTDEDTGYTVNSGQWINLCATYDGSVWKTYINGNLIHSWTTSLSIPSWWNTSVGYTTYSRSTEYFDGNVSNLIWESATWTAQEISDYYDLTKWNYWIS